MKSLGWEHFWFICLQESMEGFNPDWVADRIGLPMSPRLLGAFLNVGFLKSPNTYLWSLWNGTKLNKTLDLETSIAQGQGQKMVAQ